MSSSTLERDAILAALTPRLGEARALCSSAVVSDEDLLSHAADKLLASGKPLDEALKAAAKIRLADLYLALACARRDTQAMATFEKLNFPEIAFAYRRFRSLPVSLEEATQRLRERLFLADPPGLLGYAGLGDLRSWLRAAALHALLNVASRETRERPTEDRFFDAIVDAGSNAEAAYLKRSVRTQFEDAFRAAVERLSDRERSLLRYAFTDGMNVDRIGAVFKVHRATAARWVEKAKDRLVDETRKELVARLQISQGDAESIMRAALSRVSGSILGELA